MNRKKEQEGNRTIGGTMLKGTEGNREFIYDTGMINLKTNPEV